MGNSQGQPKGQPKGFGDPVATMWVLRVKDFLELEEMLSHEELRRRGLLVASSPGHFCIFISHQWLGERHPDPSCQQLPVLQEAFRSLLEGRCTPFVDLASQFFGEDYRFTAQHRQRLKSGYLWLDWFSIPQDKKKLRGDEVTKVTSQEVMVSMPSFRNVSSMTNQDLYISSIPCYVEASDVFLSLVPIAYHHDTGSICNFRTYLSRGWCRLELWCSHLCAKSKFERPFLVVKSRDEMDLATSMIASDMPPAEGEFTIESDRNVIFHVMRRALRSRIDFLKRQQKWDMYRYMLARYETLLGVAKPERDLEQFLKDFCFKSLEDAKSLVGFGPLECAILSSNDAMIPFLAHSGFPMERTVQAKMGGIMKGRTPLDFALLWAWRHPEVLASLLQCRADATRPNKFGFLPIGACKTPEAVDLLIQYRANVRQTCPPLYMPAIAQACLQNVPGSVVARLLLLRAQVDPEERGVGQHALCNLGLFSAWNVHCLDTAKILVAARANVNLQCRAQGPMWLVELISRARMRLSSHCTPLVRWRAEWTATPLGYACFVGAAEFADFLLSARADPELKNARGHSAHDLAKGHSVLEILSSHQEDTISI